MQIFGYQAKNILPYFPLINEIEKKIVGQGIKVFHFENCALNNTDNLGLETFEITKSSKRKTK